MSGIIKSCGASRELQAILESAVAGVFPGITMAVATADKLVWTGAAGYADRERNIAMAADHLLGIGSITKTFVAVVTLKLAAEGKLDIDDSIAGLLSRDVVATLPGAGETKVRQLLNHTSGLPSWEFDEAWIRDGRGKTMDPSRIWATTDTLSYLQNTVAEDSVPGTEFSYSNTNHTLLGLIIERVSGNKLVDEIRHRVVEPLGLSDVYLSGFQAVPEDRLACAYHAATEEFLAAAGVNPAFPELAGELIRISGSNWSVEWAAGGLQATAADLARFAAAGIAGWSLGAEGAAILQDFRATGTTGLEVGYGIFRKYCPDLKRSILTHGGDVLGYSASMGWFEGGQIAWSILVNRGTMHSYRDDDRDACRLRDFIEASGVLSTLVEIDRTTS